MVFYVCLLLNCTTRKCSSQRRRSSPRDELALSQLVLRLSSPPAEFKIVLAASSSSPVGRTGVKSHFAEPAGMDGFTKCKQRRCNDASRNFGPHVHRGTCVRLREIDQEISENHLGPLDTCPMSKMKSNMQVKNAFFECILLFLT